MKLAFWCVIMAAAMNAQTFHGVTISGTDPTITNSPENQPLLGLIYLRLDTNGVNAINHHVDYSRILAGNLLQPGETTAPTDPAAHTMAGNFRMRILRLDSAGNRTMVTEGDTTGYKILAVVFADGTTYTQATAADVSAYKVDKDGKATPMPDSEVQETLYQRLAADISMIRGIGRSLQGQTTKERSLALSRLRLPTISRGASVDPLTEKHRKDITTALSQITDEDTMTAAIGRLATLPDMVKGE